jgi:hypothetical protein
MSAARMMTTMRNMAVAPLEDPWALATGRRLIPGVCCPTYTGNQ